MSKYIRIIGDVHGKLQEYLHLTNGNCYSICLGEMGFNLMPLIEMYCGALDGDRHIIIPGNHDEYRIIPGINTFLVDPGYGQIGGFGPFQMKRVFYVRGAASIDKDRRTPGIDWFPREELGYSVLQRAIDYYRDVKPDLMITHTAPDSIIEEHLLGPGQRKFNFRTEAALQQMLEIHAPKVWVFGHFHLTKKFKVGDTTFISLGELATCDIDPDNLSNDIKGIDGYSWDD